MIQVPREPLNREAPGRLPKFPHKARERSSYAGFPSNLVVPPKTLPRLRLIDLIRADPDHFESCTLHLVFAQLQVQELEFRVEGFKAGLSKEDRPFWSFLTQPHSGGSPELLSISPKHLNP